MALEVKIQKNFEGFSLDVAFSQPKGRVAILGASGCGKSMTLKCIAGIVKPDRGKIIVNDKVLFDSEKRINIRPQERKIGYLFQNYALFPNMTVAENIAAAIRDKSKKKAMTDLQIEQFHLEGLEKRYPFELSGGQQQRVALARIMAYEPEVLLLDEPFSAMDTYLKDTLQQQMLKTLAGFKGDVILVTHDRDEAYKFCDQLMIMKQGKSSVFGQTRDIFRNPQTVDAARLTGCKNIIELERLSLPVSFLEGIGKDITHIGIRAHDFIPRWDLKEEIDVIPITSYEMIEMPFERYFIINDSIKWIVQREQWEEIQEKGMPVALQLPVDNILKLRE